ncbi:MAG: BatD family protein, partial [Polyangiaceae bacterium]
MLFKNRYRATKQAAFTIAALGILTTSVPAFAANALPPLPQSATPIAPTTPTQNPPRAFLRFDLPKRGAYVGESIPVTVRAYFRSDTGVTVTGAPAIDASDFTLAASDGVQGRAAIDGVSYRVLSWKDRLSPVKPGHYALNVSVPSTLEWQDVIARRAGPSDQSDPTSGDPFGNMFGDALGGGGDPFAQMQKQMQQMMNQMNQPDFGSIQRHDVTLRAPAITLDVKPLPTKNRPADFTDAVGHFTIAANADTSHVRTGEPITLALTVNGDGNFDRVNVAGIPESSDWKTYSPNSEIVKGAETSKTFKQPIIPLHAGPSSIPATSFSYFDPDAAKYVTLNTAPIAVDVAPGSGVAASSNGK